MNIRLTAYWALLATVLVGQVGCTSLFGHRYYEGAELACPECEQGHDLAGESGVLPPHSRFHPVPTRPVFSPQPAVTTVSVARHSVLAQPERVASDTSQQKPSPRVARASQTAPKSSNLQVAEAIGRWATETASSDDARQDASGASSRRVASKDDAEVADRVTPPAHNAGDAVSVASRPTAAPVAAPATWTDRFNTGDGWRPRVAQ